ncbi:putative inactive serine/threonine-protein kinase fnkC isoform X1 [Canna indica]|uniref:Inactive serine/threonine-protein kinase fnkC isoform X1 n=1 Tax=Canna indica TaxID=4628 RepID=A0AAQ3QFV7_9LILI|nr:putative inactive serine/threonine-protein kinase fnkC isoform X1 [Canna indica]
MANLPQCLSGSTSPRYVPNLQDAAWKKDDDATNPLKWMIDGFSILESQGPVTHYSGYFKACGFTWKLQLELNSSEEDGEKSVSLCLVLVDLHTNPVIKTIYKLFIYDQLFGQHVVKEGEDYFHNTSHYGLCCEVSLKNFNNPRSGLVVNDRCIFGVEVQEAFACKLEPEGVFECLSLQKEPTPTIHTCRIKDFAKFHRYSKIFNAGNYKWYDDTYFTITNKVPYVQFDMIRLIKVYKRWGEDIDSLFVTLRLEDVSLSTLPLKTDVYADVTFCAMDQINGNDEKIRGQRRYSKSSALFEDGAFLLRKEVLQDPGKGLLYKNTCIIRTTVTVLGVVKFS